MELRLYVWENVTENYKFRRFYVPGEHLLKSLCPSFCADIINSITGPVPGKFNVGEFYEKFVELCQFYLDIGQK